MPQIVEKRFKSVCVIDAGVFHAGYREPVKFVGENIFEHLPEKEGRERYSYKHEYRNDIVAQGILMRSGGNAERDRYQKLEYGGYCGYKERRAHSVRIENFLENVTLIYETFSEIEAEDI